MLLQMALFDLLYGWVVFHCIYIPLLYPVTCQWTFRLFPCLGCCEQCCYEHRGACIFLNYSFVWVYSQEWYCWIIVVLLLNCVRLFVTPWTAAHQPSLSFTISRSLLKLMCIESVMPSNHLILCHPLLLLPSVFPSIRVFSNELALCIKVLELQR